MKFNDFLTESEVNDLEYLAEGPKLDKAKEIGGKAATAIGKTAGGIAKGAGAAIGGIAGIGKAFAKGVKAGYKTTSLDGGSGGAGGKDGSDGADSASGTTGGTTGGTQGTTPSPQPTPGPTPTPQPTPGPTPQPTPTPEPTDKQSATAYKQAQQMLSNLTPQQKKQLTAFLEKDIAAFDAKKSGNTKQPQSVTPGKSGMKVGAGQTQQGYGQQGNTNMTGQVKPKATTTAKNPGMNPAYGKPAQPNMTAQVGKKQPGLTPKPKTTTTA